MKRQTINSACRLVAWFIVGFGLLVAGCGTLTAMSSGWQDAGGILGGVFIFGGLFLAILAFPEPTRRQRS
jgi:hypothetical protein